MNSKQFEKATTFPSQQLQKQKNQLINRIGLKRSDDPKSLLHVAKFSVGQAIARIVLLPIDVIKSKNQVNPSSYTGLLNGFAKVTKEKQAFLGLSPSLARYFLFPFLSGIGLQMGLVSTQLYVILSPVIINALLFPFESIKIRMQLASPGEQYPRSVLRATRRIYEQEGQTKFYKQNHMKLFRGFRLMLVRDLIYYSLISTTYFNTFNLWQSLLIITSAFIVSHPFDTLLTNIYYKKADTHPNTLIADIYKEIGLKGLYRGFLARTVVLGGGVAAGLASMYAIMRFQI